MGAIPEAVRRKLETVSTLTGIGVRELWSRQSRATHIAAFKTRWLAFWGALSLAKKAALRNNWSFWGRPAQQIPLGAWMIWLILAGRGWGKTRTGAQFVIEQARKRPRSRGMLVGPTKADIVDTMVLGDSGILACSPPDFVPKWEPSKMRLRWPNGSWAICRTADSPERLRGPNLDWAWLDELASFRYLQRAWDMVQMCLRKGLNPQMVITTTPRPLELIKKLVADANDPKNLIVCTRGSSWDNYWVLSKRWFRQIVARAQGALSRQEIWAEILDRVEGALWSFEQIWALEVEKPPELECVAVGVDPGYEDGPDNDETGIVACGRGVNGHGYLLEDVSCKDKPHVWARRALDLYFRLDADVIVVETNRGGQLVKPVILAALRPDEPRPRIVEVKASKGKRTRAEPIAVLWESGRFHGVGKHPKVENEMCTYVPGVSPFSPNRLDAKVWASTYLFPRGVAA